NEAGHRVPSCESLKIHITRLRQECDKNRNRGFFAKGQLWLALGWCNNLGLSGMLKGKEALQPSTRLIRFRITARHAAIHPSG
ncbi:MAG: hypothetical protein ACKPB8_16985, partial [Alphaproteobacteria bacterium]